MENNETGQKYPTQSKTAICHISIEQHYYNIM